MHSIIKHLKATTLIPATGYLFALFLMATGASAIAMEKPSSAQGESHHGQQDLKGDHKKSKKHPNMHRVHEVINAYKLERGEITQAEVDEQKEAHKAMRAKFKALKKSGDKDAAATLKAQFKAQHLATRAYVEAHPELKEKLHALREKHQKGQRNDHGKMKRMHKIVTAYKLKNGDITQAEVEQQKKDHHDKRKALHDYIEAHPDLKAQLKAERHPHKQHD